MSSFKKVNLSEVKDMAPEYGMDALGESRFAREALGAARIGLAHYRVNAGQRLPFGHWHGDVEEIYVVLSGSGRFKVDEEILDVGPQDAIYCAPEVMRAWEAGPDGLELIAFGAHSEGDGDMEQGWWAD